MRSMRILVVNDEAQLAEALRKGLSEAGYTVVATLPADLHLPERAKLLLMSGQGLDEDEAHRRMRRIAMDRNMKRVDVARRLIDAAERLG